VGGGSDAPDGEVAVKLWFRPSAGAVWSAATLAVLAYPIAAVAHDSSAQDLETTKNSRS
jgi:hypothetical protein